MKLLIKSTIFFFLLACISCKAGFTDGESKAMAEISALYGGECSYTKNVTASTKNGNTKTFSIEVKNSDFLDQNTNLAEMFISNIAYTFYNCIKKEKNKYSNVQVTLFYPNNQSATLEYSFDVLQLVDKKISGVQHFMNMLKRKSYDWIGHEIVTGPLLKEEDRDKFVDKIQSFDSSFGNILDFKPAGFRVKRATANYDILHISGVLKRDRTDSQFSIDINADENNDQVYYFDYWY